MLKWSKFMDFARSQAGHESDDDETPAADQPPPIDGVVAVVDDAPTDADRVYLDMQSDAGGIAAACEMMTWPDASEENPEILRALTEGMLLGACNRILLACAVLSCDNKNPQFWDQPVDRTVPPPPRAVYDLADAVSVTRRARTEMSVRALVRELHYVSPLPLHQLAAEIMRDRRSVSSAPPHAGFAAAVRSLTRI